jgi:hypothetical protein
VCILCPHLDSTILAFPVGRNVIGTLRLRRE